jgi:hypothetical protein
VTLSALAARRFFDESTYTSSLDLELVVQRFRTPSVS